MNLYLIRYPNEIGTPGDLIIDRKVYCKTLEDVVRGVGVKVPGETAIPCGRYEVEVTFSGKFMKWLPEIYDVPMFAGVRIHGGNSVKDSEGCILVAYNSNLKNMIWGSASDAITKLLKDNPGPHYIEIFNTYPWKGV